MDQKRYTVGGTQYVVTRFEDWNNDETSVTFVLHLPTQKPNYSVDYGVEGAYINTVDRLLEDDIDYDDEVFPSLLDVKVALSEAKVYTLTKREDLESRKAKLEYNLRWRRRSLGYAQTAADQARRAIPDAVERATKLAEDREKAVQKETEMLAKMEAELHDINRDLINA